MKELRSLYKGIEKIFVSMLENLNSSDEAEEIRRGFLFCFVFVVKNTRVKAGVFQTADHILLYIGEL